MAINNYLRTALLALALWGMPAALLGIDFNLDFNARDGVASDLKKIGADSWNVSGNNIIVSGNVHIPYDKYEIFADRAVINLENKDVEAMGHIIVYTKNKGSLKLAPEKLAAIENSPNITVRITGIETDIFGNQTLSIDYEYIGDGLRADRVTGNLASGYMAFENLEGHFQALTFKARSGIRKTDGRLEVRGLTLSSCNYLISNDDHYSVSCGEAVLTPNESVPRNGLVGLSADRGEYTVSGKNATLNIYGVPVLWLPWFYKPKDESPGLFQIQVGEDSDLGWMVRLSKRFNLTDYPYSSVKVLGDYFQYHGFGAGIETEIFTENSKTMIDAYGIYDNHPRHDRLYFEDRFKIPYERYRLMLSNVSHLTPRLDFRGVFSLQSDYYLLYDYSRYAFNNTPEQSTYAALEQQFDRFSTALYVRPRINDFYTTVERLPEFRIDAPRQEIFDTGLYYEGNLSMDYLRMRWRRYGLEMPFGWEHEQPKDYETFRLDTVHFLYYPFKLLGINFTPRAGMRLTEYSNSSKRRITPSEYEAMYQWDKPANSYLAGSVASYDNDGGNQFRFIGEIGLEATTKIYSSWQNIRLPYVGLDGLRHVIEPYVNYTLVTNPTVDRDYLFAFDEIDRIDKQNFIRLGMFNRLQTRSSDSTIRTFFSMENFWDYHLTTSDDFNHIGDFCTKLSMVPLEGLTITSELSIDAGGNNARFREDFTRNGDLTEQPGLRLDWLNYWTVGVTWEPVKDFQFNLAYEYRNRYATQSAYSMGSTLSSIQSGSLFDNYFMTTAQTINFGMRIPLTPDRRTFGSWNIAYDFYEGGITSMMFTLSRQFHCVEFALEAEFSRETDGDGDRYYDSGIYGTVYLTNLAGPLQQAQNDFLNTSRNYLSGGNKN